MSVVEQYWSGVLVRLRADVDVLSKHIAHNAERGRANELALARVLEAFLPSRWGVGSGLLIDRHGSSSKQMDIVIHERADEPAVFAQTTQMLYPVETVVACIEVKTTLTATDVKKDLRDKKASLSALDPVGDVRPLLALLAYDSEPSPTSLASHLHADGAAHAPDVACVLNWCLIAGSTEALRGAGYKVGNCLLQEKKADGDWGGAYVNANGDDKTVVRDGQAFPVVRLASGDRVVGDPGRALLLFVEALTRVGAARRGRQTPTLSSYLTDDARALVEIGAGASL